MSRDLDQDKIAAFEQRLLTLFNESALGLMISIGHRTALFDAMAALPPATSAQIAAQAGLSERYVREWLGAMTTGRIVEYDPETKTYRLPPEYAARLTRSAEPNFASMAQWTAVLGAVEDQVVDAFRHGKGVPYSAYHRFHEVMAEESAQTVVAGLDDHILPLVPGLVEQLERGIDVLDVGCGSGRAMIHLARRFPRSRFTGYDISEEGAAAAQATARQAGVSNVRFEVRDVAELPAGEAFDLITAFDAIHDQARPAEVLQGIHRALRDDGLFLMQDILASSHVEHNMTHPVGTFIYTISCMHCMSVSLAGGGPGLGAAWGKELALQMLADAGFGRVQVETLPHDIQNYYYLCRKA